VCTYSVLRLTKNLLRLLLTLHKDIIADRKKMSFRLSKQCTTDAFELSAALAWLGLNQYEERLRSNGFDDWESVTAITETDMVALDFKRGDRRKLQRAIQSPQQAERTTRRYRRHPRPDPNAPHKPKTAYVLFGEHIRQDPTLSRSSFTDIAKETGRGWRD
jgi:hypothetical protein